MRSNKHWHPSLSGTQLTTRFLEAFFCALSLAAAAWTLAAVGSPLPAAALAAAAAAAGLLTSGAHIGIPIFVRLTRHGRRLLAHHPWADAASSSALCLAFAAAAGLLLRAAAVRGCLAQSARPPGWGAGLSPDGSASKAAQMSFSLDDHIHIWPRGPSDLRSEAAVGWTMLVEVLFAGQLNPDYGRDPDFQQLLASHVKRIWRPSTTAARGMDLNSPQSDAAGAAGADAAAMAAIFDAGEVSFNPRRPAAAPPSPPPPPPPPPFAPAGGGAAPDAAAPALAALVSMRPEAGAAAVGPGFVGFDMIETTLRAFEAGQPPAVAMWAPYTQPNLTQPYEELSDYERVMLDAFDGGYVSFDSFRPLEGAEARRRARAAEAAAEARRGATVCSLVEACIAACLLSTVAFGASAVLAGLEVRQGRGAAAAAAAGAAAAKGGALAAPDALEAERALSANLRARESCDGRPGPLSAPLAGAGGA
ncbi:hypothetical protein Rsub_00734 [Raphidocelis subcapitata]|uniref:Uncharacterized protein n=1 Tax=Raphidocelis subcapitata TaxID=307507 RepID=A0A2V0NNG0_9CHLO|nr:hypothetical protein Rsub_00734 [Raphidocelis subcapitata]|eukprot:GBF88022.1 hypothetical protein Rsub_00734 [Raphidocelis subcapitata]